MDHPSSTHETPPKDDGHPWMPSPKRILAFALLLLLCLAGLSATQPEAKVNTKFTADALARKEIGWIDTQVQAWCKSNPCQKNSPILFEEVFEKDVTPANKDSFHQAYIKGIKQLKRAKSAPQKSGIPKVTVGFEDLPNQVKMTLRFTGPKGSSFAKDKTFSRKKTHWSSVLPPLVAMLIAICFGRLLLALGGAIWLGAALSVGFMPHTATWKAVSGYGWGSVSDGFNLYVIGFTLSLVGMVHVILKMGGMAGLLERVKRFAKTARATRVTTALMGLVLFFDDYANTIVVGSTMRPLTDAKRISREKLAYLVDATSAPVAGLAIISTWIGFEVGLFEEIRLQLGLVQSGYAIFFEILPLRFYCIFTLFFVFFCAFTGRDFGPMRRAEERTWNTGALANEGATPLLQTEKLDLDPAANIPHRARNAIVPILSVLGAVFFGMVWSGWRGPKGGQIPGAWESITTEAEFFGPMGDALGALLGSATAWRDVFSNADNAKVLFYSAITGSVVAIALALGQRLLTLPQALRCWFGSIRGMWMAIALLVMAWSIRAVCVDLNTSTYLIATLDGLFSPALLPILTFLLAAMVAFATGTSWGTMGILLPTMIPLAHGMTASDPHGELLLLLCFGAVLDGAIFGDHCSPISDTTVMSSISSQCDHLDHVKTQVPYAVVTMSVGALVGYIGVAQGLPVWAALASGPMLLLGVLLVVGKKRAQITPSQ